MSLVNRIKQSQKVRDDLLRSDFNLKINDLIGRVSNAEKHIELLYDENAELKLRQKELEECNCRIGKRIGLSIKQQDQLKGYHEGHEEQQGYDHYDEPDHEDDSEALASAGFGTDEDYGLYSEEGSDRS